MAGGANKRFMREKERFLMANLIEADVADSELIRASSGNVDTRKAVAMKTGRLPNQGAATGVSDQLKAAGIYDFDLVDDNRYAEERSPAGTSRIPVYKLKPWGYKAGDHKVRAHGVEYKHTAFQHTLAAFWLPWSSNSSWSVQLGPQADYFFTATMDGCSLAISSGIAPIVTHSNYKSTQRAGVASEGLTRRRIEQQHQALHTDIAKTLMKGRYAASASQKNRGINQQVTVVGFRNPVSNTWSFYWQRRKVILGDAMRGTHTQTLLMDRLVPIV